MVHVRLEQFEGPLDLLLQLIEQQQLDISTVSLAEVTDQYLGTLEDVERLHPEELADFLVVAAKLLLIKSRILLPQLDLPDEDGISLEAQLRLYQTFVAASESIRKLIRKRQVMFGREHAATVEPMFAPPARIDVGQLRETFAIILERLEPVTQITQTTIARTISLHEKIRKIRELIESKTVMNFRQLLEQAESRMDVIVTFLALLELVKQRTALVVQDENFSDIRIQPSMAESTNLEIP